MKVFDLFSKRQKRLRGEVHEVFQYDSIPNPLRVQIVMIWEDIIGPREAAMYDRIRGYAVDDAFESYKTIVDILCREKGTFQLTNIPGSDESFYTELVNYFLNETDAEQLVDVIEVSFNLIDNEIRNSNYRYLDNIEERSDAAILELNARLKEHGVGYQFAGGEIVRVDSELLHAEAVKPALRLLSERRYAGAQEEFLNAHKHYREGYHKEAMNEALKSFESLMKNICENQGWRFSPTDTSSRLIDICYEHQLIPKYWQDMMKALRKLLESGVPTGRNKNSGHGQGSNPVEIPTHIVAYVMHMTAAAIVFLAEAEKALSN